MTQCLQSCFPGCIQNWGYLMLLSYRSLYISTSKNTQYFFGYFLLQVSFVLFHPLSLSFLSQNLFPNFMCFFNCNSLSPINGAHKCMGVCPSAGTRATSSHTLREGMFLHLMNVEPGVGSLIYAGILTILTFNVPFQSI